MQDSPAPRSGSASGTSEAPSSASGSSDLSFASGGRKSLRLSDLGARRGRGRGIKSANRTMPTALNRSVMTPTRTVKERNTTSAGAISAVVSRLDRVESNLGDSAKAWDALNIRVAEVEEVAKGAVNAASMATSAVAGGAGVSQSAAACSCDVDAITATLLREVDVKMDACKRATEHDLEIVVDSRLDTAMESIRADLEKVTCKCASADMSALAMQAQVASMTESLAALEAAVYAAPDDEEEDVCSGGVEETKADDDVEEEEETGAVTDMTGVVAEVTVYATAQEALDFHKGNTTTAAVVGGVGEGDKVALLYPMMNTDVTGETWCRTVFVDVVCGELCFGWVMVQSADGTDLVGDFRL